MFYCHNCGNQLADGSKFCPKCGTQQNYLSPGPHTPAAPNITPRSSSSSKEVYPSDSNKLILRTGYSNKMLTLYIFSIIIEIIAIILVKATPHKARLTALCSVAIGQASPLLHEYRFQTAWRQQMRRRCPPPAYKRIHQKNSFNSAFFCFSVN